MNQFARPGLGVTELPPVNADDNGKVLGVSDGAWAKVAASGGSDLPDDPAQDGTYNLQNTVSSGTSTLSWASGSSGGGVLVVNVIPEGEESATMDKTWQEIYDAPFSVARVQTGQTGAMLCQIYSIRQQDSDYYVSILLATVEGGSVNFTGMTFRAESANDYPTTGK